MMEEKDNITQMFEDLREHFDTEATPAGHEMRFLDKLAQAQGTAVTQKPKRQLWKPLSIAASIAILVAAGLLFTMQPQSTDEQLAETAPEVSNTKNYYAGLIEREIAKLETEATPETRQVIDDALAQLENLEKDYEKLEQDLLDEGNPKLLLSAMITNFQTRIDLLENVMEQIEEIKMYNKLNDESDII
ncbi:hypothetical protein [Sediminicola luteus]|nr:hypothetical protein [Sediminicola luteus]